MDRLSNLNTLLNELKQFSGKTYTVHEHFVLNRSNPENKLSIRVDVDNGLVYAEELAKEFHKLDIKASFYFLTLTAPYSIFNDAVKNIHSLGHEVGLHTDHLFLNRKFGLDSIKLLKDDVKLLSELIGEPIKGMCFHGNGQFDSFHNWKLYRDLSPQEFNLQYHDGYTSSYCSQTSSTFWLPPVENCLSDDPYGWLDSTEELKKFFKKAKEGASSHLMIHPQYFFDQRTFGKNPYNEYLAPLPNVKKNYFAKINKGLKFVLDKPFRFAEFILRGMLYGIMALVGKKTNFGHLNNFAKQSFIDGTLSEPNLYAKVVDRFNLEKTDTVLDIGFGAGQFIYLMAGKVDKVYGVEPAEELYQFVNEKIQKSGSKNVFVNKGVGENLNFEGEYFDKVICMSVLMMTNPYSLMREARRVLKKGGHLIMHVSDIGYSLHSLRDGIYCRDPKRIKGALNSLMARYRRSVLRQYNVGGVFTSKDLKKLADMTGFEIIHDYNEGYYEWEPKTYWGTITQHLVIMKKK